MTTVDDISSDVATPAIVLPAKTSRWSRIDFFIESMGERLNPILVKETRQALKSRQFMFTFALELVACWIWTFVGMAFEGPSIYYRSAGADLFYGYFFILAFPLALIVPFMTFRSVASESEENTFDVLSITTLSSRQLVSGKLGSAAVQVLVYLSAAAPCLAFCYLLRGVDVITIGVVLLYSVLGSLGLCVCALFVATLTRERVGQVVLSVLVVLGLFWAFVGALAMVEEFLYYNYAGDVEFWIVTAALFTAYVTTFALVFHAAASRLAFESENRSTPLRIAMVVQHCCFAAWMLGFALVEAPLVELMLVYVSLAALYWFTMGALMTGENPEFSPRVMRRLPQSLLGRIFFTWFNPGPGTGLCFAIGGLFAAIVFASVVVGAVWLLGLGSNQPFVGPWINFEQCVVAGVLVLSYTMFFLGLGQLAIALLRRYTRMNFLVAFGVHLVIVATFTIAPLAIQMASPRWANQGYSLLQITNPFWTVVDVLERGMPVQTPVLVIVVPAMALIVMFANLPGIAKEIRHVRVAAPMRVAEEDLARTAAAEPVQTSPWD